MRHPTWLRYAAHNCIVIAIKLRLVADPRECICADGVPAWCDRHGDLWYSDDGNQHRGTPPAHVAREREAYEPGHSFAAYPIDWQYPPLGLTVSWVDDDGRLVMRSLS